MECNKNIGSFWLSDLMLSLDFWDQLPSPLVKDVGRLSYILDMNVYKQPSDHFIFQKPITQKYSVNIQFNRCEYKLTC